MSAEYRVFETAQFQKDLGARLSQRLREVVYPQLRQHSHHGPNIRKLRGYEPETWRYRIGDWRFFYEVDERSRIVLLVAASHRGSAD